VCIGHAEINDEDNARRIEQALCDLRISLLAVDPSAEIRRDALSGAPRPTPKEQRIEPEPPAPVRRRPYCISWSRDAGKFPSDTGGMLQLLDDGTVAIDCEDDYYTGRLTREESVALAKEILETCSRRML